MVFIRKKKYENRAYYSIVESKREGKTVKQHILRYIGTAEKLLEDLRLLDRLKRRYCSAKNNSE